MKYKKLILGAVFLVLGLGGIHAQEAVSASGGEASGEGGTASYTVGQAVYTTVDEPENSVSQGVQQYYEISATTGFEITFINLDASTYPNPVETNLTLTVKDVDFTKLKYLLFDMQGKLINSKKLVNYYTNINMENLPASVYFLKVTDDKNIIKTYKIIKY